MALLRKILGDRSEEVALKYLKKRGYRLVARNYACPLGEIDLIMQDGETLVFVEVRSKSDDVHGLPEETVDWRKQKKLRAAAGQYLLTHHLEESYCRFDVVSILWNADKPRITLYQDAF